MKNRRSAILVLLLAAVSCSKAKTTGLPRGPVAEPIPKTQVSVADLVFKPATLSVKVGEEVTWAWSGAAPHNVRFTTLKKAGRLVDSHPRCAVNGTGCSAKGDEPFKLTFDKPGTYAYFCILHGQPTGQGMAGTISVTT